MELKPDGYSRYGMLSMSESVMLVSKIDAIARISSESQLLRTL